MEEVEVKNDGPGTHPLKASFDFKKCSKGTLIDLLDQYSRLYLTLDAFWYLSIKAEFGNAKALEHDLQVWEKLCQREVDGVSKALKIKKRDIPSFFRVLFMTPWSRLMKYEVDIKDMNRGVVSFRHCPTLSALERMFLQEIREIIPLLSFKFSVLAFFLEVSS
jgi:hypothetical protein